MQHLQRVSSTRVCTPARSLVGVVGGRTRMAAHCCAANPPTSRPFGIVSGHKDAAL